MEKAMFDYSKVPYSFGLCAVADCPRSGTCLRRIAYDHIPESLVFPPTLNPKAAGVLTEKCKYYCPDEKVRYAKGFVCTTGALSVNSSAAFRYGLIGCWGIRRYYQKRKGETLLSPAEQQLVIRLAKKLGLHQEEYFDSYIEEYHWG